MKTIHVAQGNPDASQDGSALWPFRVNTAEQFDKIFRLHREPTVFLVGPGEYRTCGCWAHPDHACALLGPNSHLVGTHGSNATVLRLDEAYERPPAKCAVEVLIGGGYRMRGSNQMLVSGLTIDVFDGRGSVRGGPPVQWGATIEDVRVVGGERYSGGGGGIRYPG